MTSIYKSLIEQIKGYDRLIDRIDYEYRLYFSGMRKTPPVKERNELERSLRRLVNYSYPPYVQFQLSRVAQRFNTYKALWDKKFELFIEYGTADMVGAAVKKKEAATWDKKLKEDILNMEKELKEALKLDEEARKEGFLLKKEKKDEVVDEISSRIIGELERKGKKIKEEGIKKIVQKKIDELQKKFSGKEMVVNYELKEGKIKFKVKVKK